MKSTNPWFHALAEKRGYITPEDITAARDAGAALGPLHAIVLRAINEQKAEDYRLCAFVAVDDEPSAVRGGTDRAKDRA